VSYGGTSVSAGDTPTISVARDQVAGRDYQAIKAIDPTEGSTTPIGTESNPTKVKPIRRGTTDYDSGLVEVTNGSPASVTSSTIYPEGGTIGNTSSSVRTLTLTNTADANIAVMDLAPHSFLPLPVPQGGSWVGLKAGADGTGVVLQVAGRS